MQRPEKEQSRLLNKFRKDRSDEILSLFKEKKKEFRKLRKRKKAKENENNRTELKTLPKGNMWTYFKKKRRGGGIPKSISSEEISDYFEGLLNSNTEEKKRTSKHPACRTDRRYYRTMCSL